MNPITAGRLQPEADQDRPLVVADVRTDGQVAIVELVTIFRDVRDAEIVPHVDCGHAALQANPKIRAKDGAVIEPLEELVPVDREAAALWENPIHPHVRNQALAALASLARLDHREATWDGDEWWGTTPSTRRPYYAPVE